MPSAEEKLISYLTPYAKKRTALAFSGGADSTLLLFELSKLCRKEGGSVYAFYASTALNPRLEAKEALNICQSFNVSLEIIEISVLEYIKNNPINRCYLCKKHIFSAIANKARQRKCDVIFDGTNSDDLKEYRPGIKALHELDILSPLALMNINKTEVRHILKNHDIKTAAKPSAPCLATRFPYGTCLTQEKLDAVGNAESKIKALGFYNVRVRAHDNIARIELDENEFSKALAQKNMLLGIIKQAGFDYVTLDLEGFKSGSMDKKLLKNN
ncbi:ATP-dependent sacrificial sulfur transferase LarE [Succinatimonas hippei]|uniref:TIGR00268 family protein n=1 Tax=Succinatimonas hippei (strain DSM 22608 / JCM 16073 / KCTC 15190 / YIT 12066) TaxID=762983 RepID=E8LIS6_SUCHY|nr:ATP-dependent sacrificial sulfur transferase LarE [Succinatimonas hippei]EFY07610.1 TIGR00268 family protein [Succinatimonas hippei YIT 12066]MDM8119869.1 ATP-dependent sacrificial sulfur transferase LarE [Succinatimonas hippei]